MALFNPPKELNGFPLSERSKWLLYAPIKLLINPKLMAETPFQLGQYFKATLQKPIPGTIGWAETFDYK